MTQAMLAHPAKGARFPVTLSSGDRILEIDIASVQYAPPRLGTFANGPPTTCVSVKVLDPSTGAKDPKYPYGNMTCIDGLAYRIQ